MHGVYKTDQLTNWPIGAAFFEGIRGFGRGKKMFEGKPRNVWELGVWMHTRFFGRSPQQHVFLPSVVWMTLDSGFIDSSIMSSWTERSAVKDLKGVSWCKQILRFAQMTRRVGICSGWHDRGRGLGRLVSWSVFMHALICVWCHDEMVCMFWLADRKEK